MRILQKLKVEAVAYAIGPEKLQATRHVLKLRVGFSIEWAEDVGSDT
jgi:hypothetical protein